MSDTHAGAITLDELNAMLSPRPVPSRAAWVDALCLHLDVRDLDDAEVCEIAAECDERGRSTTIAAVLNALKARAGLDRVTLALLAALEVLHLSE